MDPEHVDLPAPHAPSQTWLEYYAEASKRRRARGWHRRRDFSSKPRWNSRVLTVGVVLALAAIATAVAVLMPR